MARKQSPSADICLLLEGTYPYVSGGVSTWVDQLLTAYPEWKFAIFYLGGQKDDDAKFKYEVPSNVVAIEEVYLFDPKDFRPGGAAGGVPSSWNSCYTMLRKLFVRTPAGSANELEVIVPLMEHIMAHRGTSFEEFFHAPQTWSVLRELYDRYAAEDSFLHFFWTCRYLIEPLWKIARALPRVPKAKLYHSACTGYAGFLGAVISHQTGAPLLLSEHGIYLKERIQDIYRSPWISDFPSLRPALMDPLGSLRRLWIGFFDVLSRLCYAEASHLVSLFGRNARVQEHFGADAEKISIVPNGIAVESCDALLQQRAFRISNDPQSRVVGYLGRVVSIKDVKTLLRAARLVCDQLPDTQFLIAGPTTEEPEYYKECADLTQQLQLEGNVRFLGSMRRDDVLPLMDVMVLTSISEGLPFVLLEAMASGIPVVSTDVGACRELIEGRHGEDPPLGPCGIVTEIGATEQIARALVWILSNRQLQDQMSRSGRVRVQRHY
ncbi:MAG TPA: GT4 family glycosyltransferase PelF, partial [Candidatus Saccharimonadia bacterium]|nr:GT4 family glycosyltransferase PelF [Candidatus Saccharimonadia bacterium]